MVKPRFDVKVWRQRSVLVRFLLIIFCRHYEKRLIVTIPYQKLGDDEPCRLGDETAFSIHECCICGEHTVEYGIQRKNFDYGAILKTPQAGQKEQS